jgi:hypothetical protein
MSENPSTSNPALPWQTAAFAIVQQVQSGVPFGTADMSAIIESACVAWAVQQTAALRAELDEARRVLGVRNDTLRELESQRDALAVNVARLREALELLYDETADYIRINKLGDVHHNRSMQLARDALAVAPPPALAPDAQQVAPKEP